MCKQFLTGMMAALILLSGTPAFGGESDGGTRGACLDQLTEVVQPGKWIRVTAYNGNRCEGRLGKLDVAQSLLTLRTPDDNGSEISYEISDITKLQYRDKGQVKAVYVILGTVAGAFIGANIGAASAHRDPDAWLDLSKLDGAIKGSLIGGLLGLGAGVAISLNTESTITVKCR